MNLRRSLSILAVIISSGILIAFLRTTPDAWPFGDEAVIQVYTLQALRGALVQGPYSQFGWHHPGPLYFYLLVPAYALSGQHAIGLTVGALAINLAALWIVWWLTIRNADSVVAAVLISALALFAWRAKGLVGSVWNPHVIVLPLTATIVAAAAACKGDRAGLVILTILTSFLMQTHVSMVPLSAALIMITLIAAGRTQGKGTPLSRGSLTLAGVIGALLWLPTVIEAVRSHGRNPIALLEFFQQRGQGPNIGTVIGAWSAMLAAPIEAGFHIPWGAAALSPIPRGTAAIVICQLVAITFALVFARKSRQRFLHLLAVLLAMASGIALLSIGRIPGVISDYQIFWLSGIGTLMWGASAAVFIKVLSGGGPSSSPTNHEPLKEAPTFTLPLPPPGNRRLPSIATSLLAIAVAVLLADPPLRALYDAREYANGQRFEEVRRRNAAQAVRQVIAGRQFRRPLIATSEDVWNEAVCVVLDAVKHHPNLAVDRDLVTVFGDTLAPNGLEDAEIVIAGPRLHRESLKRIGTVTIFVEDGLFVDVRPIVRSAGRAQGSFRNANGSSLANQRDTIYVSHIWIRQRCTWNRPRTAN